MSWKASGILPSRSTCTLSVKVSHGVFGNESCWDVFRKHGTPAMIRDRDRSETVSGIGFQQKR